MASAVGSLSGITSYSATLKKNNDENIEELDSYLLENNGVEASEIKDSKELGPGELGGENYNFDGEELINYYDFNEDGKITSEDISPQFVDNKDLDQNGIVNIADFIKAFTVDISKEDEPEKYQENIAIAERAMQLKDTNKDGQITFGDWDMDGDGIVNEEEALKNTDLDGDGYFTPEDTEKREQFVFGGVSLE